MLHISYKALTQTDFDLTLRISAAVTARHSERPGAEQAAAAGYHSLGGPGTTWIGEMQRIGARPRQRLHLLRKFLESQT
jgi:hypothetical protein